MIIAAVFGTGHDDNIGIEPHHFRGRVAQPFRLAFPRSLFDDGGATLDIAQLAQPLAQDLRTPARAPRIQDPDPRQAARLLCLGSEGSHRDPCTGRANEVASIDHDVDWRA